MPKVDCSYCGEEHKRYPSRMKDGEMFCSRECSDNYKRRNQKVVDCEHCGEVVRVPPSRQSSMGGYSLDHHFCDKECESAWKSNNWVGEGHPAWSGGLETLQCEECGQDYKTKPANKHKSKFCSWTCKRADWADNPETRECHTCGNSVTRQPTRFKGSRVFCSSECFGDWQSEKKRGSGNPAWKGGKSGISAVRRMIGEQSWDKSAREVRKLAGHICKKCHKFQPHRKLSAHHIIPVASGGTNGHWNLMVLCQSCHQEVENYTKRFTEPHLTKYAPNNGGGSKRRETARAE